MRIPGLVLIFLASLSVTSSSAFAEGEQGPVTQRDYRFAFAPGNDLRTQTTAGPTAHRMLQDLYLYQVAPHLGSTANEILGTAWSMAATYSALLWPHEFGHWSRARQVDSRFVFNDLNPILPNTTVDMPDDAPFEDQALLSVGGFEVNSMIARDLQLDFYRRGGAWSDEMAYALANESFFFIYTLIFPADPEDPTTWMETRGDPVHAVLPVYQRFTGRDPVRLDGTVDPELVDTYNEYRWLSIGWTLLDPGFIQQALAFVDRGFDSRRAWMPVRSSAVSWTWGTQFTPTPLGYELHLNQYFLAFERALELTAKFGRPFDNRGLRLHIPDLYERGRWRIGSALDGWDQGPYGLGGAVEVDMDLMLSDELGLNLVVGYKSEGYAMGRAIEETAFGALGMSYEFAHGPTENAK